MDDMKEELELLHQLESATDKLEKETTEIRVELKKTNLITPELADRLNKLLDLFEETNEVKAKLGKKLGVIKWKMKSHY